MVRAAAAAGYGLGATVVNTSRMAAQKMIGGASVVSQAAQTYQYTEKAARDTGSSPGDSRKAGAWEAFKTVMTGSQPGGPRAAGERIYADHQRAAQFADVRNSGADRNTLGVPPGSQKADAVPAAAVMINASSGRLESPTLDSVSQGIEPYLMPSSGSSVESAVYQNHASAGSNVTIADSPEAAKTANARTANAEEAYSSSIDSW
jgi:hypothetical protein